MKYEAPSSSFYLVVSGILMSTIAHGVRVSSIWLTFTTLTALILILLEWNNYLIHKYQNKDRDSE